MLLIACASLEGNKRPPLIHHDLNDRLVPFELPKRSSAFLANSHIYKSARSVLRG